MNNVATVNLPQVPFTEVDDILVNGNGTAGRITKANFLGAMNDWSTITNKPFEDFEQLYFRTTERTDGADILTLSDSVIASLNKVSTLETEISKVDTKVDNNYDYFSKAVNSLSESISSVASSMGQSLNSTNSRVTVLETSSHTHDNKSVIDLFNTNTDGKLVWNNTVVGSDYELPVASNTLLGGVKIDASSLILNTDNQIKVNDSWLTGQMWAWGQDKNTTLYLSGGVVAQALSSKEGFGYTSSQSQDTSTGMVYSTFNIDLLGEWVSGKSYKTNYYVTYNQKLYRCTTENNDDEFLPDNWEIIDGDSNLDFETLSTAITAGTQTGITVTADNDNERFNFEVTGIPTIAIDSEGYWTVDGERGENPTKAQGEKGDKGADGTNGVDGISPRIDETSKHWFIGETDTGVNATAGIDDTSTTGTDVSWSAKKLNDMIGNINSILASVTGGVT